MHIYIHKSHKYYNKRFCHNEQQYSEHYLGLKNNSRINPGPSIYVYAVRWKATYRSQECAMVQMVKNTGLQAQGETELLQLPYSVRAEGFETLTAFNTYNNVMPNLLFRREHFIYQKVSIEFIKVNLPFRACK